jgi:dTDP-4-dehydrorhamnose reductase
VNASYTDVDGAERDREEGIRHQRQAPQIMAEQARSMVPL